MSGFGRDACDWVEVQGCGIRSIQMIELPASASAFEHWGAVDRLEDLFRRYFDIAARLAAPLVCVRWENNGPVLRLRWPSVPLIAMGKPVIEPGGGRRAITVPVLGGLLSQAFPNAHLSIVLTHRSPQICALVELDGYQPRWYWIPGVKFLSRRVQARLHVAVGRRLLRDLADEWEAWKQ